MHYEGLSQLNYFIVHLISALSISKNISAAAEAPPQVRVYDAVYLVYALIQPYTPPLLTNGKQTAEEKETAEKVLQANQWKTTPKLWKNVKTPPSPINGWRTGGSF